MKKRVVSLCLTLGCLLSLGAQADAPQQDVLARLVANASKNPPGPIEKDLPSNVVQACAAFLKMVQAPANSLDQHLASDFNTFSLDGPLVPIYANAKAALMSAPIKLSAATLSDPHLPLNPNGSPGFGDNVGGCMYLNDKTLNADGRVTGTFCFVLENGAWKVHNYYISNAPLDPGEILFLQKQLDAYAQTH